MFVLSCIIPIIHPQRNVIIMRNNLQYRILRRADTSNSMAYLYRKIKVGMRSRNALISCVASQLLLSELNCTASQNCRLRNSDNGARNLYLESHANEA
ncbi:hypothetical protein CDAR_190241 [Caerostris darwini]|uniref:Uncharacterized protein n=1 Tax=Caerostris darwini TaxID=1538125 RepID=A0AAV4PUF7_9ARAC|nr:hypothetical protein CDAR_190241 [Caerostris darwini]